MNPTQKLGCLAVIAIMALAVWNGSGSRGLINDLEGEVFEKCGIEATCIVYHSDVVDEEVVGCTVDWDGEAEYFVFPTSDGISKEQIAGMCPTPENKNWMLNSI